jgi:hypothetical protein
MEENKSIEQLTKKERRELKHQQKTERRESAIERQKTKRYITWSVTALVVLALVGGLTAVYKNRPQVPESEVVSRNGLHWHPELLIYTKGVKQKTPANLGISGSFMAPVQGLVKKSDITLGQFFKSWGRDINSFGTNVKMTVNGKENTELGNYIMQDKDKIELNYE